MSIERTTAASNLIDVLDRVLDKGIVVDAWVRVSLVGIELVTVEARVVVASLATYLGYADALAELRQATAPPTPGVIAPERVRSVIPAQANNGRPSARKLPVP
jgi:gas vesicle structural protein